MTNLSNEASSAGNTNIINNTAAKAPAAIHRSIGPIIGSSISSDMTSGAKVMIMPEVRMVCVDDLYALRMDSTLHSDALASR